MNKISLPVAVLGFILTSLLFSPVFLPTVNAQTDSNSPASSANLLFEYQIDGNTVSVKAVNPAPEDNPNKTYRWYMEQDGTLENTVPSFSGNELAGNGDFDYEYTFSTADNISIIMETFDIDDTNGESLTNLATTSVDIPTLNDTSIRCSDGSDGDCQAASSNEGIDANFGYQIDGYDVQLNVLGPTGSDYGSDNYIWRWQRDAGTSDLGSGNSITTNLSGGEGNESITLIVIDNNENVVASTTKSLFIGQGNQQQGDTDGDGNPDNDTDGDGIYDPIDDCPSNPDPNCTGESDDDDEDDPDPSEYQPIEGGLVVCDNSSSSQCGWTALVDQVSRLITWLIRILTIAATLIFIYAGFILVTSGGNTSQRDKAKNVIQNVVVGFAIVLLAWVIISTLLSLLVDNSNGGWWDDWGSQVVPIDLTF